MAEVILVAEDEPQIIDLLRVVLETKDYEIYWARDGEEAFQGAKKVKPDLILLDIMMPKLNGYEVLHLLKENLSTKDIPVIFLSGRCETNDKIVGLKMGGQDFISKPFDIYELLARVEVALRIKNFSGPFRRTNRRISEIAIADPLTGLYNKGYFLERFEEELLRAQKHKYPLACILLEVNHFQTILLKYGQIQTDQLLQRLAVLIKNANRVVDLVGRYSENQYIILLTQTDKGGAQAVGKRIQIMLSRSRLLSLDPNYFASVSLGITAFSPGHFPTCKQIIHQTEQDLQRLKTLSQKL